MQKKSHKWRASETPAKAVLARTSPAGGSCLLDCDDTLSSRPLLRTVLSPEHFRFWELRGRIRESIYPTVLDEQRLLDVQVAVSEACADALKRARKKVGVVAWELEDRVVVEITGTAGIPLDDLWGSEAHSARFGVSLMALLADQVQISRLTGDVTRVSLTFLLDQEARPVSERERAVRRQNQPGRTERLEDPRVHGLALTRKELKEQKQLARGLVRQAFHDPLTGLANRALLFDRLENALARARRCGASVGIMVLDMDGFKEVNDSLGHVAGDRLLCMVAARLMSLLRAADTAARMGGDEFVVVLSENIGEVEISSTAERILRRLQEPYDLSSGLVSVGFSMGVALSNASAITAVELVNRADTAMYMVKANGKGGWRFFHPQMLGLPRDRRNRETELLRAIENQEVVPYFQPVLATRVPRIVGFEVLARWEHPANGLLRAEEFIDFATETGLIVPLGARLTQEACLSLRRWDRSHGAHLQLLLNASRCELAENGFVDRLIAVLEDTGIPPGRLVVEIPGDVLADDGGNVLATLLALRERGVRLAVHDFGIAPASLYSLQDYGINMLKTAWPFATGLSQDRDGVRLASAAVEVARALRMQAVVQGVENAAQLTRLRAVGCEMWQGAFFSLPVASSEVPALLGQGTYPRA